MKKGRPKIRTTRQHISCRVDQDTFEFIQQHDLNIGQLFDELVRAEIERKERQHEYNNNDKNNLLNDVIDKLRWLQDQDGSR